MAKFCGKIGYAITEDTGSGVWVERIVEREHKGDLLRNISRSQPNNQVNDDLTINNQISILADEFAYENFQSMKYAEFMGAKWKITSAEVQRPRIILNVGGVYNG
jgi:hypothetical protein